MITKVFFLCTFALAVQSFPQNVQLLSKVPSEPIEDPNSWAWGRHPKNGYGYKARNSLTLQQCKDNPETAGTVQCDRYDYSYPLELCISMPRLAPLKVCEDADFPKDFCVSNAAKMIKVNGCKPFLNDLCTNDVSLAVSADCADAEFPKDFCVSNAVKMIKVKGCASYKTDLCTADISLALSSDCAGAAADVTFFQCTSDPAVCRSTICEKRVPNKDFCP